MSNISDKPMIMVPGPIPVESEIGNAPERRRVVRYPFTAAAEIMDLRSHARVAGRSSDLGLGGCYIDILSPFTVGSAVRVRLEREQKVFEAMATVTNAQNSMGMGLAFTEVKPEHQAVLQAWVAELSGEALPKFEVAAAGPESGEISTVLNLQQALNELINLMVRKKVINESEGSALLRQIFR
jgi:PilZ domain-containing protein